MFIVSENRILYFKGISRYNREIPAKNTLAQQAILLYTTTVDDVS